MIYCRLCSYFFIPLKDGIVVVVKGERRGENWDCNFYQSSMRRTVWSTVLVRLRANTWQIPLGSLLAPEQQQLVPRSHLGISPGTWVVWAFLMPSALFCLSLFPGVNCFWKETGYAAAQEVTYINNKPLTHRCERYRELNSRCLGTAYIWPLLQYGSERVLRINLMLFSSICEEEEELYCSSTDLESGMGHLLFAQCLWRAVAGQSHRLWGKCAPFQAASALCFSPFQSFGFPSTSLVLVSILILRFLPCSRSCCWPSGLHPESQFGVASAPQQTSQLCCQGAHGLCFLVLLQGLDVRAGISVETEFFPYM